MIIFHKKIRSLLVILALFAFVLVSFVGAGHAFAMEMNKDGSMDGCIFTGKTMLCKMNIIEHISFWQSIFTATVPQKINTLVLLILLAGLFRIVSTLKRHLLLPFSYLTICWKLYIKQNPHLSLFNPLQEVFSQGILNPKIYEAGIL